ncbi:MAG TPA: GNAT family N-acetyltransferase [Gammaproteobacteria bacterium]|jgi:putative hemolysin|nr:GNAT family N-acetyltransferase [Gammaproteobacteria bacterium]
MLSVENAFAEKFPAFFADAPRLIRQPIIEVLRRLFRETSVNEFLQHNQGVAGVEFIDKVLEYFSVSYSISNTSRENIPVSGRVVIFANHPLGALDALCLIKLVSEVRSDVRIVANEMLTHLEPLGQILLPVDAFAGASTRLQLQAIQSALEDEQAVIFFPAGEVSRVRPVGVRDTRWNDGFIKYARRTSSPLLPCYIDARNSAFFYGVSALNKPAAGLLLVNEMFRQRARNLPIKVGELIPADVIQKDKRPRAVLLKQVKKHLYRVGKNRSNLFPVEQSIAHPESRQRLKAELAAGQCLGKTHDQKSIYLMQYQPDSTVIKEIGRLREISFRKVGEGTGQRRDLDRYDQDYEHIVLWDDADLEVVGAYRVRLGSRASDDLYVSSLFELSADFAAYSAHGLELGRSFVQPRYWGSKALDYLWQGIGAYLYYNPDVRYLFGPVSLSNAYPRGAVNLIVHFYTVYFGRGDSLVEPRLPYRMSRQEKNELVDIFRGDDYKGEFKQLKHLLRHYQVNVPTLYKQYPEVFAPQGVQFLAWNIDEDFGACIDGFLMADLSHLKPSRRKRYIDCHAETGPISHP